MKDTQLYLFPVVRMVPIEQDEYISHCRYTDLKSVDALNSLHSKMELITIFIEDLLMVPLLEVFCRREGIPVYEMYTTDAKQIYNGVTSYIKRNCYKGITILIIPGNIHFQVYTRLSNNGNIVLDRHGMPFFGSHESEWGNNQCPLCGEHALIYQEGALVCMGCGYSKDG